MNIYVVSTSFLFHSLHAIGIIQLKIKRTDRKGIDNLSFCNLFFSILYIYILLRWFSLCWKIQCWIFRCRVFHDWIIAIAVIQLWGRIAVYSISRSCPFSFRILLRVIYPACSSSCIIVVIASNPSLLI